MSLCLDRGHVKYWWSHFPLKKNSVMMVVVVVLMFGYKLGETF